MRETASESPFLTYLEAAAYCKVDRTTLYRAVKAGRLKASGPGSAVRFRRANLDTWMDSRTR
jgi:excisionase family DNA binding protein